MIVFISLICNDCLSEQVGPCLHVHDTAWLFVVWAAAACKVKLQSKFSDDDTVLFLFAARDWIFTWRRHVQGLMLTHTLPRANAAQQRIRNFGSTWSFCKAERSGCLSSQISSNISFVLSSLGRIPFTKTQSSVSWVDAHTRQRIQVKSGQSRQSESCLIRQPPLETISSILSEMRTRNNEESLTSTRSYPRSGSP